MTLLFSKQCILPSFRSKGRKLQLCGQGRGETPNQGAGCSRAAMAEDADEEMPVIELGTGRRGLSMEAGRAHQEEDSDDEPIAGSGHRELEFQTKCWFACLRKRIRARSALHACLRAHPRAACMPTNVSARMWHLPFDVTQLGHSPPDAPDLQFALAQPSALLHTPACKLIRTHSACVHAVRSCALHACQRVRARSALCCINSWLCCCGHVITLHYLL